MDRDSTKLCIKLADIGLTRRFFPNCIFAFGIVQWISPEVLDQDKYLYYYHLLSLTILVHFDFTNIWQTRWCVLVWNDIVAAYYWANNSFPTFWLHKWPYCNSHCQQWGPNFPWRYFHITSIKSKINSFLFIFTLETTGFPERFIELAKTCLLKDPSLRPTFTQVIAILSIFSFITSHFYSFVV